MIYIEENKQVGECKYHCYPTCHPAQVGDDDVFGCTHEAWGQNRNGDFCPIVNCGGKLETCEISLKALTLRIIGRMRRIKNAQNKIALLQIEVADMLRHADFIKNLPVNG